MVIVVVVVAAVIEIVVTVLMVVLVYCVEQLHSTVNGVSRGRVHHLPAVVVGVVEIHSRRPHLVPRVKVPKININKQI